MLGCGGIEQVVVPAGDQTACFKAQLGNQEWATAVECVGSGGQVLPPLIITKGTRHTVVDHHWMKGIPASWQFAKTSSGWTTNKLAIFWDENIFDPNTRPLLPSAWHLLIIEAQKSHISSKFCDAVWSRRNVIYVLPTQVYFRRTLKSEIQIGSENGSQSQIRNSKIVLRLQRASEVHLRR